MKFLSKLAELFAKGLQVLGVFEPVIEKFDPALGAKVQVVSQDLTDVFNATVDAEKIAVALGSNTPGAQKLQIAIPLVSDIVLQSAALTNHKIANQDLYNQGVEKLTSGAADIVNSLHTDGIVVTDKKA